MVKNPFHIIDRWIVDLVASYTKDHVLIRKSTILIRASLITAVFMLGYYGASFYYSLTIGINILLYEAVAFACVPFLFLLNWNMNVIGNIFVFIGYAFGIALVTNSGGIYSPVMPWLSLMPICGLLFANKKSAWVWAFVLLATTLIMVFMTNEGYSFPKDYDHSKELIYFANCYCGLIFIYLILNLVFENGIARANLALELKNEELAQEKDQSEKLLLNILPEDVASELKESGEAKARLFENTTVLFTDFVNFTGISQTLTPHDLVDELHKCFTAFDNIMIKHGLEKIKTIGDAYLAACGLPNPTEDHAYRAVEAAFDIIDYIKNNKSSGGLFDIRIGLCSGSLVAGIVGTKKFAYDIWGDTVNTASRLQDNSSPGRINISQSTYNLVKDSFLCTDRGKIQAKNQGMIQMYYVDKAE